MAFDSLKQTQWLYLNKPRVFDQISVNQGIPLEFRREFNLWRQNHRKGSGQ